MHCLKCMQTAFMHSGHNNCSAPAVYASVRGANHTNICGNPQVYSKYAKKWFNAYLKNGSRAAFQRRGELSQDSQWTGYMSKGI